MEYNYTPDENSLEMTESDLVTVIDSEKLQMVLSREDFFENDELIITTKHSRYFIRAVAEGQVLVDGGWFDKHGLSPYITKIEGATWGWGDIYSDIIAKNGMRIKFDNGVVTSQVKQFEVIKAENDFKDPRIEVVSEAIAGVSR